MLRVPSYPPQLARFIEAHWPTPGGLPISLALLEEALSVCFQASLTSEEGRPTRFRLLLTPSEQLPEQGVPNQGVLRLRFDRSRPLSADELRRLSPSVPFESALIGAQVEEGRPRIWGIAHSGPAWLAPSWGGRRSPVPNWTYDPIVHVTGPGKLAVRCAGKAIGALERGEIVDSVIDVFDSEWLPALFTLQREEVREEFARGAEAREPISVEHTLVGRVSQHMLRRAIQLVRGAGHGGMILIVDSDLDACSRALRLKYRFEQAEPSRRFRTLLFQILDRLARKSSRGTLGWADFVADESAELGVLEQAVFELSRLFANLTAVDGALVLDKRFSLLGFGAEVSAELPAPTRVWRSLDSEGSAREEDDVESVGTRHRAAYRFVKDHPRGLALVISHDGGVSFVCNRDGEVMYWSQSVSP